MSKTIKIDDKTFQLFIPQAEIEEKIKELASRIEEEYEGRCPVFIIVLNGAFVFAGQFFKTYQNPCKIEFVKLMSYIGTESSGEVISCIGITEEIVKGQDVVVVEDIIESGLTMDYFLDYLINLKPTSVRMISMLFKPDNLKKDINLNDYCFSIPPKFVVGYGLDYNDKGRNLTDIYQIVNE